MSSDEPGDDDDVDEYVERKAIVTQQISSKTLNLLALHYWWINVHCGCVKIKYVAKVGFVWFHVFKCIFNLKESDAEHGGFLAFRLYAD